MKNEKYTKKPIPLDQDWADQAVTYFCGDLVMNQWSIAFYYLIEWWTNGLKWSMVRCIVYIVTNQLQNI